MKFNDFLEEYNSIVEATKFKGDVKDIDISSITPEPKDIARANKLTASKAPAMAKAIKDPLKLVRRYKAVVSVHGLGEISNAFKLKMIMMGFSNKQIESITSENTLIKPEEKLLEPAPWKGNKGISTKVDKYGYDNRATIMNARVVYKGKLSKVIPELTGRNVILLGKTHSGRSVAIIGSAYDMKDTENGLDYYHVGKEGNGFFKYKIDTGNGYREPQSEIYLSDYVLVDNGKAVTKYEDKSYNYWVFK